jgi:hypothetical protein
MMWRTSPPIVTVARATGWPRLIARPNGRGLTVIVTGVPGQAVTLTLYRSNTRLFGWPALSPAGVTWCWLACRVLLKIVYLLTCRVLGLVILVFHGGLAKNAELLMLRHENAVLRRQAGRVR